MTSQIGATDCTVSELINIKDKITIYTLAEELSMTPSMVSRAFNPNAKIAEEKRMAVLEAAEKHGFIPNKFASRLSMRTIRIGILIVYKAEHVRDGLLRGFRDAFGRVRDYKLEYSVTQICASEKSAHECRDELFAMKDLDGVILSGFGSSLCHELICDFAKVNPNIVFVQNVCDDTPYLLASKHDEELAASIAAELLSQRLHYSKNKNIFVFTGDRTSSVHKRTFDTFLRKAKARGLHVIGDFDMKDRNDILSENIDTVLGGLLPDIGGIYITSGNSSALCEWLAGKDQDISLVCSDVNDSVSRHIENGTVFATLCQDFETQAKNAFEALAQILLCNSDTANNNRIIYTDVIPVFLANLHLYKNK